MIQSFPFLYRKIKTEIPDFFTQFIYSVNMVTFKNKSKLFIMEYCENVAACIKKKMDFMNLMLN